MYIAFEMEPLKEMFNAEFTRHFAKAIKSVYPKFDQRGFIEIIVKELPDLELNQRLRLYSKLIRSFLPEDYTQSVHILKEAALQTKKGYTSLIYPDFVALYGKINLSESLQALKYFTRFGSSEFAIREFLRHDFKTTLSVMKEWAHDQDEHVRRLASEGSRPRLPWSFKLDEIVNRPEHTFPILNQLRSDPSLYVRKSVANHLNDISKDHPEKLVEMIKDWDMKNPQTYWIMKHACRTLLKKGDKKTLLLFQFDGKPELEVRNLKVKSNKLRLGENLEFSFQLCSLKNKIQKLVVDYVVVYPRKSGSITNKIFKLKEIQLGPDQKLVLSKKQVIKDFSTRKHFTGRHSVIIQINGKQYAKKHFELVV